MADVKISALPASTTPLAGTEVLPVVQSNVTVQVSVADLTAGRAVSASSLNVTGVSTLTGGAVVEGVTVGKGVGAIATNTALGRNALSGSNSGSFNTAVGESALVTNTTGAANSALGNSTLNYNTIGAYNLAAGGSAMFRNISGNSNTSVGSAALQNNTTGSNNIALGADSGIGLTTGSNNTIIGSVAGTAGLADTVIIAAGSVERLRIDNLGNSISSPTATPPTLATNGQMVINLTSNTNLRISVRGSDGTTRVANITLT